MNYQEIMDVLREKIEGVSEFAYNDFGTSRSGRVGRDSGFIEGIGECVEVDQHGGEGEGETWWSVKYFPDHDIYIRVDGFYTSYDGTDFDMGWGCCREVKPKEKMIVVYE